MPATNSYPLDVGRGSPHPGQAHAPLAAAAAKTLAIAIDGKLLVVHPEDRPIVTVSYGLPLGLCSASNGPSLPSSTGSSPPAPPQAGMVIGHRRLPMSHCAQRPCVCAPPSCVRLTITMSARPPKQHDNSQNYVQKLSVDRLARKDKFSVFGWQYVSSAGFPTPTSLASAARTFFDFRGSS
jgi:hypothetical protein